MRKRGANVKPLLFPQLADLLKKINSRNSDIWINVDGLLEQAILVYRLDDVSPISLREKHPGYIVITRGGMLIRVYEKEQYISVESIHDVRCDEE